MGQSMRNGVCVNSVATFYTLHIAYNVRDFDVSENKEIYECQNIFPETSFSWLITNNTLRVNYYFQCFQPHLRKVYTEYRLV